jgi:transposase
MPGKPWWSLTRSLATAQILIAALGASNLTYAEARWTQGLADRIACHVNAFAFLGGVTRQVVCDNLKAGVTAACRYEPLVNRTYADMASHYSLPCFRFAAGWALSKPTSRSPSGPCSVSE